MKYYPVFLDVKHRHCLVVGGGSVGARKVSTLLDCNATVTVVSPTISAKLNELAKKATLIIKKRPFLLSDLKNKFLVIGATDNQELNRQIHAEAERLGILCNIADRPEACNFILPSIVKKGDLVIAISTSGSSPAFAKKLRKDFESQFGNEYAEFLELMGAIRKKLLAKNHKSEVHKPLFEQLINRGLVEMIKNRRTEDINLLLHEVLGEGYIFEALMPAGHLTD
ncbi:MAG: bifunctional precorrin-2 dehydrogenase/sirohydrochlorin ferrochelatase [Desulfobacterales bacterium]|nr:MAG: bifunctional precorrin-2 dehydrogenase/sirohydrochlorin ferrochelatase [Desulfobacterales bacterium]UCD88790.1 MAG: bifunctional precorrin-2 dehydrogenase/sirohydrochlorin ferrochelatase [Desulfobacterales bacterium]